MVRQHLYGCPCWRDAAVLLHLDPQVGGAERSASRGWEVGGVVSVGQRIREGRAVRGWSQQTLADHLDTDRNTIWRWETDRRLPPLPWFMRLADVLEIPPGYLWRGLP